MFYWFIKYFLEIYLSSQSSIFWKPISSKAVKIMWCIFLWYILLSWTLKCEMLIFFQLKKTNSEVNVIHRSRSVHNIRTTAGKFQIFAYLPILGVVWTSDNGVVSRYRSKIYPPDMNLPNLIWPHYLRSIERITNGLGALLLQAVTWACQIN